MRKRFRARILVPMDSESEISPGGRALARSLARRIECVTDLGQRTALMREFCLNHEPPVVAEVLQVLLAAVVRGRDRDAWMALVLALCRREIPYSRVGDIYRGTVEGGYEALRLVFIAGERSLRKAGEGDFSRDDLLDGMSLGERKAKARTQDKEILGRLLFDPDSAVVHILLRNPRITEGDVLKLASKRPNRPGVLVEIADVGRWVIRSSIRRAIVLNPYSPSRLAVTLMPLMTIQELMELRVDGSVQRLIRESASALLELRGWNPPTVP
jgi:hypothetical protein